MAHTSPHPPAAGQERSWHVEGPGHRHSHSREWGPTTPAPPSQLTLWPVGVGNGSCVFLSLGLVPAGPERRAGTDTEGEQVLPRGFPLLWRHWRSRAATLFGSQRGLEWLGAGLGASRFRVRGEGVGSDGSSHGPNWGKVLRDSRQQPGRRDPNGPLPTCPSGPAPTSPAPTCSLLPGKWKKTPGGSQAQTAIVKKVLRCRFQTSDLMGHLGGPVG